MILSKKYLDKLSKYKLAGCPPATQSIPTNLANRQKCISEAAYGPLNPNETNEDYWKAKAKMFGGDPEVWIRMQAAYDKA